MSPTSSHNGSSRTFLASQGLGGKTGNAARRSYPLGRWLRYAQVRWLEPELVVEASDGSWFADALVPTVLQVFRRRTSNEAAMRLGERTSTGARLDLALPAGLSVESERLSALVGVRPECPLPAGDLAAILIDDWAEGRGTRGHVSIAALEAGLLAELSTGHRTLATLEPGQPQGASAPCPRQLAKLLGEDGWTGLAELGVSVRQGLRTGANEMFYAVPVAPTRVRLSPALGGHELDVPAEVIRPALRYQADVSGYQFTGEDLRWVVFDPGPGLHPDDLADYPECWRDAWRAVGMWELGGGAVEWIERGAAATVRRKDVDVSLAELSAVGPNRTRPPAPDPDLPPGPPPRPPRGWYALRLKARHQAPVALGRMVHHRPSPLWNVEGHLVDANFSTFEFDADAALSPPGLVGLLASTVAWAALELQGTPMGGGALKVEATQLPVWKSDGDHEPHEFT